MRTCLTNCLNAGLGSAGKEVAPAPLFLTVLASTTTSTLLDLTSWGNPNPSPQPTSLCFLLAAASIARTPAGVPGAELDGLE